MTDFVVPVGWKFDGASQDGNQTTFVVPNSTVAEPNIALFNRTRPVVAAGTTDVTTKARYSVRRIVNEVVDGVRRQAIVELTVRFDPFMDPALVKSALADVGSVASDTDFQSDVVDELYLPR